MGPSNFCSSVDSGETVLIRSLFILAMLGGPNAQAAHPFEMPTALHLVSPSTVNLKTPVKVSFSREGDLLIAKFEVEAQAINAKVSLGENEYPYQFDVVEVFVSATGGLPYYEFELSPYNQPLTVKIEDPKKKFQTLTSNFEHETQKTLTGWTATLKIPLKNLNWSGNDSDIVGNAFAILGKSPRTFWSLFLPRSKKPNFHQPQFFKPLL